MGMFVDTYFEIACSFTNVNLITSTRAYVYYVPWMNVFEESFDLACLPQDMEVKFPFGVFVKFCYEFPTFKFISPTKWLLNAYFCSFIKPMDRDNRLSSLAVGF